MSRYRGLQGMSSKRWARTGNIWVPGHALPPTGCARRAPWSGIPNETFVARALAHLGTRLSRDNPLDEAFDEFLRLEAELEGDFECFFPELMAFCQQWQQQR
ncbi:MAG: ACP phosphodiesterase [Gammaproteobacteria bacterium]|nr:ACP phosphodiesterase [Gammaproteobacteria bacterium]